MIFPVTSQIVTENFQLQVEFYVRFFQLQVELQLRFFKLQVKLQLRFFKLQVELQLRMFCFVPYRIVSCLVMLKDLFQKLTTRNFFLTGIFFVPRVDEFCFSDTIFVYHIKKYYR
jgi:hypothetical protein